MIGSLPHTNPAQALEDISRYLPEIPAWPQLPRRSWKELMHVQVCEGFPGLHFDASKPVYDPALSGDHSHAGPNAITKAFAAGLYAFREASFQAGVAVKGQCIGPVTWGFMVK